MIWLLYIYLFIGVVLACCSLYALDCDFDDDELKDDELKDFIELKEQMVKHDIAGEGGLIRTMLFVWITIGWLPFIIFK